MAVALTQRAQVVPEPDLSMEVQDLLKRGLAELEAAYGIADDDGERAAATARVFAAAAVAQAVATLKKFDPEASKETLSTNIKGIIHSEAVIGQLGSRSKSALRQFVPCDRGQWLAPDIEGHAFALRAQLQLLGANATRTLCILKAKGFKAAGDPATQVVVLSAGGASIVFSIMGGFIGTCGGIAMGAFTGVVPALLTFGLSIPAGAVIGGGLGCFLGTSAGAFTGVVSGGAGSHLVYRYRLELKQGVLHIRARTAETASSAKSKALQTVGHARAKATEAVDTGAMTAELARSRICSTAMRARAKASELGADVGAFASDRGVQTTAASAATGAFAVGTGGGALGLVAGGAVGAACGLVPAFFTFGLSIPVGAALGGGAGLCTGAATGGAAGFLGGGTAGYGLYRHRKELSSGAAGAWNKVSDAAESMRDTASASASYVKARFSGTGGTA